MNFRLGHSCVEVGVFEDGRAASLSDEAEDTSEFERRLRECRRVVYHVAFSVLGERADAEEIVQDAFLRAYRKLSSLREPEKFRAWVTRMSFRLALNRRRAASRAKYRDTAWLETTTPPARDAESIAAEREIQSRLRGEIDRLSQKLRAVLWLSAVEELSTRDIGEVLAIPEGTVRSRLHLARKELLRVFANETV